MRQRRRCAGVCRRSRVGDAFGDGKQQHRRYQCRLAVGDAATAVAVIAAVAAATLMVGARRRRRHRIAGCRCRWHVFVTGRRFGSRDRSGFGMRAARLQRCHRRAHAVRHEGEAEQDVQQERVQAHAAESTPVAAPDCFDAGLSRLRVVSTRSIADKAACEANSADAETDVPALARGDRTKTHSAHCRCAPARRYLIGPTTGRRIVPANAGSRMAATICPHDSVMYTPLPASTIVMTPR